MQAVLVRALLLCMIFVSAPYSAVSLAQSIEQKCSYTAVEGQNPSYQTVNCLLTETALQYNIPPEVIKGIAVKENGSWKQFDEQGNPIESPDHGLGLMQITFVQDYDVEQLKNDIVYNIRAGVEILDSMFQRKDLPTIGTHSRSVIEHWYFAVMAYNGTKPINSPIIQQSGERNKAAYQEQVFKKIEEHNLFQLTPIPFQPSDFDYNSNSTENIKFITKHYSVNQPMHYSKHLFKKGESVFVTESGVSLRQNATTDSERLLSLQKNEVVKVTDRFIYDQSSADKSNHFVWYPVQRQDGTQGFIASSYLESKPFPPAVNEVNDQTALLTGTAKAGETITLTYPNTVIETAGVHADGTFQLAITPQKAGTPLTITAEDEAGNRSEAVIITVKASQTEQQLIDLLAIVKAAKSDYQNMNQLIEQYGKR